MANDFSSEANLVALYRHESGALGTDASGNGNTLTNGGGLTADTTNYREGAASGAYDGSATDYQTLADASLSADFPAKNGAANTTFTILFWYRPTGLSSWQTVISKAGAAGERSFCIGSYATSNRLWVNWSYGTNTWYDYYVDNAFDVNAWSHVAVRFDDANNVCNARVHNVNDGTIVTGAWTPANAMRIAASAFYLGSLGSTGFLATGQVDEVVILDRLLSDAEIDAVYAGTFGASSSSASSSSSSLSSSSLSSSYSFSSSSSSSIAPLQFPSLSKGVDLSLEESVADTGLLVSDPNEGRRLVGVHAYRAAHRLRLSVSLMTQADRRALARFYLTTTAGPVLVWEWTHPKSGQTYLLAFDPDTPPVWSREPSLPDKHHAEFTVIEHIQDGYLTGVYA